MSTDQGRHIAELRNRARFISLKDRDRQGRDNSDRAAIEQELADEEPCDDEES